MNRFSIDDADEDAKRLVDAVRVWLEYEAQRLLKKILKAEKQVRSEPRDDIKCKCACCGSDLVIIFHRSTRPDEDGIDQYAQLVDAARDCLFLLEDWFPSMDDMKCADENDSRKIDKLKALIERPF